MDIVVTYRDIELALEEAREGRTGNSRIHLFVNDHNPTIADNIEDYAEAEWEGYLSYGSTRFEWSWPIRTEENEQYIQRDRLVWCNDSPEEVTVCGFFATEKEDKDSLLYACRFDEPWVLAPGESRGLVIRYSGGPQGVPGFAGVITGLTGEADGLDVQLDWDVTPSAARYQVQRSPHDADEWVTLTDSLTVNEYLDDNPGLGHWDYRVRAGDDDYLFGPWSTVVSVNLVSTALLWDTFNDVDGANLTAHTMDVGGGWTVHDGSWDIQSNQANSVIAAIGGYAASADAGQADVSLSCLIAAVGTHGVGVRVTDSDNLWLARWTGAAIQLFERSPSYVLRASTALSGTGPYTMVVDCTGTVISAQVGPTAASYASAAFNQTATRFGLVSTDVNQRWDDFLVE